MLVTIFSLFKYLVKKDSKINKAKEIHKIITKKIHEEKPPFFIEAPTKLNPKTIAKTIVVKKSTSLEKRYLIIKKEIDPNIPAIIPFRY